MGKALCRRSDGLVEGWSRWDDLDHDGGTHILVDSPTPPDAFLKRWDDATGLRDSTQAEKDALDTTDKTSEAAGVQGDIKTNAILKVIADNTAGKDLADIRGEFRAAYRALWSRS